MYKIRNQRSSGPNTACRKVSLEKNVNKEGKTFPVSTQLTFTCSKLTIEILEKGVKYVQS